MICYQLSVTQCSSEIKPTTRLVLSNEKTVSHLSAMTVQHSNMEFYDAKRAVLGPDPLREDADFERLWRACGDPGTRGGKMAIGAVLMNQRMIAGVGNIYRAEICFKARVHPDQPAGTLGRLALERVWRHSVDLLGRGFKQGSILTVDEDDKRRYDFRMCDYSQ